MVRPLDIEAALDRQQRFGVWAADRVEKERAERRDCCCIRVLNCLRFGRKGPAWPPPEIATIDKDHADDE